jgi:hypothetical protein
MEYVIVSNKELTQENKNQVLAKILQHINSNKQWADNTVMVPVHSRTEVAKTFQPSTALAMISNCDAFDLDFLEEIDSCICIHPDFN